MIHINNPPDNPVGHFVIFKPSGPGDSPTYGAVQDYFVSLECWDDLEAYFASRPAMTAPDAVE